jgi:hypothetical protein
LRFAIEQAAFRNRPSCSTPRNVFSRSVLAWFGMLTISSILSRLCRIETDRASKWDSARDPAQNCP